MPQQGMEQQLAQVAATGLQPLYVIHGEEDLLRVEALDVLRAEAKRQGYTNREVYTVDAGFDWNELLAATHSVGLFADLSYWKSIFQMVKQAKQAAMPCKC